MFDISTITVDNLMERTALLSDSLSAVADSPEYLDAVSKICGAQKVTDAEQITSIQQTVGLVLLGFIRPGDLGNEINQLVGLNNPAIANAIAQAVQKEIFAPISAELERSYRPVSSGGAGIPVMPRSIDGIRPPVAMPSAIATGDKRQVTSAPVVVQVAKPAVPTTPTTIVVPVIKPTAPSSAITSNPSPITSASSAPAPFVIHKETSAVPVQPKATFKIEVPTIVTGSKQPPFAGASTGRQAMGQKVVGVSAPARIEFGKGAMPAPAPKPTVVKTESEAPRMVRYVQPKTDSTQLAAGAKIGGPVSLSSIGITPAKPPATRPSLNIALEKPSVPLKPPPRPPVRS